MHLFSLTPYIVFRFIQSLISLLSFITDFHLWRQKNLEFSKMNIIFRLGFRYHTYSYLTCSLVIFLFFFIFHICTSKSLVFDGSILKGIEFCRVKLCSQMASFTEVCSNIIMSHIPTNKQMPKQGMPRYKIKILQSDGSPYTVLCVWIMDNSQETWQ